MLTPKGRIRIITLTPVARLALPPILISSMRRNAIGFSFERGGYGVALGVALLASSVFLGYLLSSVIGPGGFILSFWLTGGTGSVILLNAKHSMAFVKPLCRKCRLLPVVVEHESLHLSGIQSDDKIWEIMRRRYSCEGLGLENDPDICWFCPIPKRLKGE